MLISSTRWNPIYEQTYLPDNSQMEIWVRRPSRSRPVAPSFEDDYLQMDLQRSAYMPRFRDRVENLRRWLK